LNMKIDSRPSSRHFRNWVLGFFLPFAASAFAGNNAVNPAAVQMSVENIAAAPKGSLFKASRGKSVVWLYSTIHVGEDSFFPLSAAVNTALKRAQVLLVEVDVLDPNLAQAFNLYGMSSKTVALPPKYEKIVTELLKSQNIDLNWALRVKPQLLGNLLALGEAKKLGYSTNLSSEAYLIGFARALNKPVVELEGIKAQLTVNDHVPYEDQRAALMDIIDAVERGEAVAEIGKIVHSWMTADLSALEQPNATAIGAATTADKLESRNKEMASKIIGQAEIYTNVFVGLGILHFIGESAVTRYLEREGFRIAKIQ
jgi:uncharacterized protein YbaP (TraB family)